MAAHHHTTGQTITLYGKELTSRPAPPFPVGSSTIVVCHNCTAEAACFDWLGWQKPNFVDTLVEFRLSEAYADYREEIAIRKRFKSIFKNYKKREGPLKLNTMARALGVTPLYSDTEKAELQMLAASGKKLDSRERQRLTDYCISDTLMTRQCLPLLIWPGWRWDQAVLRADFVLLCERMKRRGVPVWVEGLQSLLDHRAELRDRVIAEKDRWGFFDESGVFKNSRFISFLITLGLPWPRCEISGRPALDRDTFREQAKVNPLFKNIHNLREEVDLLKRVSPPISGDARVRTDLRPFTSKTGRCQPGGAECLYLMPKYMRKFITAPPGRVIIQGDYSQQEVLVAAALSKDPVLLRAYEDGDCYVGLGKELGLIPPNGTKETHPLERKKCKPLLLGLLYSMGVDTLAEKLSISRAEAKPLHKRLRRTFECYFSWADAIVSTARSGHSLVTTSGWRLRPRYYADSVRTRINFLIQSTAADCMRTAGLLADEAGLELVMTVHDSLVVEADDESVATTLDQIMKEAAAVVLGAAGKVMRVDIETAAQGYSLPLDETDEAKFQEVMRWVKDAQNDICLTSVSMGVSA
jgi:hypothetical protein